VVHAGATSGLSQTAIVQHIVGRAPTEEFPAKGTATSRVRLRVRHLSAPGHFAPISVDVHAGEIVGLAGLPDAGCREVLDRVFSSDRSSSGVVEVDGRLLERRTPLLSLSAGMALLTDDRLSRGLCLDRPLRENISLAALTLHPTRGRALRRAEDAMTATGIAQCDIRPPSPEQPMTRFSGGNQQKVLLARWLAAGSRILLLSEPTRGVDVGARTDLYRQLRTLTADGAAILVQSSDFRELLGLADRVLVMRQGSLVGEFLPDAISEMQLLSYASVGEVAS
jgi:ribose transport system ATP-binding protein